MKSYHSPLIPSERKRELEMIRLSQGAQFSHQIGSFEPLDGKALPFVPIWGIELKALVRGVERDLHVLSGPSAAQGVDLSAQRHPVSVVHTQVPARVIVRHNNYTQPGP